MLTKIHVVKAMVFPVVMRVRSEAEAPILWPPDEKNWLIRKDHDAGKDWRHGEKGMTEDKMIGWHHWLDGHEFEWAPGDGKGQGSLMCFSPWGHKQSDMTERLNWAVSWVKVTQLCLTLCDPMDYTVRGILLGRILEWVTITFSRGSSQPRESTQVSQIAGGFFTS